MVLPECVIVIVVQNSRTAQQTQPCNLINNFNFNLHAEHNTIRQTTRHNSFSLDAVFCRNRFAEETRRNDFETMCTIVFLTKSSSWLFSYRLFDSVIGAAFLSSLPAMDPLRRSRREGRVFVEDHFLFLEFDMFKRFTKFDEQTFQISRCEL